MNGWIRGLKEMRGNKKEEKRWGEKMESTLHFSPIAFDFYTNHAKVRTPHHLDRICKGERPSLRESGVLL